MTSFAINPPNTALVDNRGYVTPEWYRFFAQIQQQIGGPSNPFDDTLLGAGGQGTQAVFALAQEDMLPAPPLAQNDVDTLPAPVVARNDADVLPAAPVRTLTADDVTDLAYILSPPRYGA